MFINNPYQIKYQPKHIKTTFDNSTTFTNIKKKISYEPNKENLINFEIYFPKNLMIFNFQEIKLYFRYASKELKINLNTRKTLTFFVSKFVLFWKRKCPEGKKIKFLFFKLKQFQNNFEKNYYDWIHS